jgi:predicted small secreted protein
MRRITAIVLATCIVLSGCATDDGSGTYDTATADALQSAVLSVTEASASGDPDSALTRLNELQATLLGAYTAGSVSQARFDMVTAAIDQVRADLELAIRESTGTTDDESDSIPEKPGKSDKPEKPGKPGKDD